EVAGWVYSTKGQVVRIIAFLDNIPMGTVTYGVPPADTAPPHVPVDCGFLRRFHLDEFLVGRRLLIVNVTDDNGNSMDFVRTVTISATPAIDPSPTFSQLLDAAPMVEPIPKGNGFLAESVSSVSETPTASSPDFLREAKKSQESLAAILLDSFLAGGSVI